MSRRQCQQRLPQLVFSVAVLSRKKEQRLGTDPLNENLALHFALIAFQFVAFGRHQEKRPVVMRQKFTQRVFFLFRPAPNINNNDDAAQVGCMNQIVFDKTLPALAF